MSHSPSPQARAILADAIAARPGWKNTADSVRSGSYGNAWTEFALSAIEAALQTEPDDEA